VSDCPIVRRKDFKYMWGHEVLLADRIMIRHCSQNPRGFIAQPVISLREDVNIVCISCGLPMKIRE
jgi:hypothetical protein